MSHSHISPVPVAQVVEHLFRDREVPAAPYQRCLKWFHWLPCLVLSIKGQALASLLLTYGQLTSHHLQISPKKWSDNNNCLYSSEDRMEDWQS